MGGWGSIVLEGQDRLRKARPLKQRCCPATIMTAADIGIMLHMLSYTCSGVRGLAGRGEAAEPSLASGMIVLIIVNEGTGEMQSWDHGRAES